MPNWKTELARLQQAIAPPINIGGRTSFEDQLDYVCRGLRGDKDVLLALQLNPHQNSLQPDGKDHLLEVIRALWLDSPSQPQAEAEPVNRPAPLPPIKPTLELTPSPQPSPPETPATAPTPTSQQAAPLVAPITPTWLGLILGGDVGDPSDRATSTGATVIVQPEHPNPREYQLTPADRARTDVIWVRSKAKLVFRQCNLYWTSDPFRPQPEAAPAWVKEDATWVYALRSGLLEEYSE